MTELSFLVELLLNHKLPRVTKDLVAMRIKEVESGLSSRQPATQVHAAKPLPPHIAAQAPSTQAIMARHGDVEAPTSIFADPNIITSSQTAPTGTVTIIAQTPAAQAALASREASIQQAMSGKPARGETRPRKF